MGKIRLHGVENGVIKGSGINRNNLRINFDTDLNENFRTGVRLNLTDRKVEANKVNLDQLYMRILPTRKVYNEDGTFKEYHASNTTSHAREIDMTTHFTTHPDDTDAGQVSLTAD